MKTIAIMSLKGGVGKTTTAINLAAILATEHDQRVLLIDADGQRQAAKTLLPGERIDAVPGLSDFIRAGTVAHWRRYRTESVYRNLDILPGDNGLWDFELAVSGGKTVLRDLAGVLALRSEYDFMLIDCPPHFSIGAMNALLAADFVLIPAQLEDGAEDSASETLEQVQSIRTSVETVRVGGILLTRWYRSRHNEEQEEALRERGGVHVFKTVIRDSRKVHEGRYEDGPVASYSPRSSAARDYRKFVRELLAREKVLGNG